MGRQKYTQENVSMNIPSDVRTNKNPKNNKSEIAKSHDFRHLSSS
jgi:hypothetical protein